LPQPRDGVACPGEDQVEDHDAVDPERNQVWQGRRAFAASVAMVWYGPTAP